MPVSGRPRNPFGEQGRRFQRRRDRYNPLGAPPNFFHAKPYINVEVRGRSPGTMFSTVWGERQQPGVTIRRLWRQMLTGISATPPFSSSANSAGTAGPVGFEVTRALRYMVSTRYRPAGVWRYSLQRRFQRAQVTQSRAHLGSGTRQHRPVLRNRMTSFGSRVDPLNRRVTGAEQ